MHKIKENLIFILLISVLIFSLFSASSVFAVGGGVVPVGVIFTPYEYPEDNKKVSKPTYEGCDNRTSGYSTTTGESCVGNIVKKSPSKPVAKNSDSYVLEDKEASPVVDSDINENYGGLTANALFGSDSFMPSGLLQWVFFTGLIVAIILLWRYIHHSEEKYMSEPLKHA